MSKETAMITVAIDGPAGAGKSTIAKAVARELGVLYLDTGAMYRAMAYALIKRGVSPLDREKVLALLDSINITVQNENGVQHTFADGEDVTEKIRTQEIAKGASDVGINKEVRIKLAQSQREFAKGNGVVMDGREIGTFVLPDAKYKFYVTASVEERAHRRMAELEAKGGLDGRTLTSMMEEIAARDATDMNREFAPLKQADDAVLVDTTALDISAAVELVLRHIRS